MSRGAPDEDATDIGSFGSGGKIDGGGRIVPLRKSVPMHGPLLLVYRIVTVL